MVLRMHFLNTKNQGALIDRGLSSRTKSAQLEEARVFGERIANELGALGLTLRLDDDRLGVLCGLRAGNPIFGPKERLRDR